MENALEIVEVVKRFGAAPVVTGASLALRRGEIGCLLGPSGSGKTTLLRAVAGLESIDGGEVRIGGRIAASSRICLPPEKRGLGMVFQDHLLFPHLTVRDNVLFGLRNRGTGKAGQRAEFLLNAVGLAWAAHRYPHELSGGQQQRVALARALAPKPELLLLDEPFSSLDVSLRERLSLELRDLVKEEGVTTLMVTHARGEAYAMADMAGVMFDGAVRQWSTPHALYHRPVDAEVAAFAGEGALIAGRVLDGSRVACGLGVLRGEFVSPCAPGCDVDVLIRPEDLFLDSKGPVRGRVLLGTFRGAETLYRIALPSGDVAGNAVGDAVSVLAPSHLEYSVGDEVGIRPEVRDLVVFSRSNAKCTGPTDLENCALDAMASGPIGVERDRKTA